jgi:hypothetical protein
VESILDPLSTAATPDLLYLPWVIVRMEKLVEWTVLAGETEVLREKLPRRHFVHHKSYLPDLGVGWVNIYEMFWVYSEIDLCEIVTECTSY